MTFYEDIPKLSDTVLSALAAKARGGSMRTPYPDAPYVLRRWRDGTFSCIFGTYLDEDYHRQCEGEKDGARSFSIAALKGVWWDYMSVGRALDFFTMADGGKLLRGIVREIVPGGKLQQDVAILLDVDNVAYRVHPRDIRTRLETMLEEKLRRA